MTIDEAIRYADWMATGDEKMHPPKERYGTMRFGRLCGHALRIVKKLQEEYGIELEGREEKSGKGGENCEYGEDSQETAGDGRGGMG